MSLTIGGVRLRIDFTFLVFSAMLFLLRDSRTAFAFLTVCLVHESAHAAVLRLVGGRLSEIIFLGMGIRMIPQRNKLLSAKRELAVLLAGPAANLVLFAAFSLKDSGNYFAFLNLCAALFNLLPYSFLDGGAALNLLFGFMRYSSPVLAAVRLLPVLFAVYAVIEYGNPFFIPLFVSIFYFLSEFR
ncbi:MAG: hypothetical protein LUG91_05770 [Ruminococcus sp.]|nr:hypothetical protein [Ruminococcus sp.]